MYKRQNIIIIVHKIINIASRTCSECKNLLKKKIQFLFMCKLKKKKPRFQFNIIPIVPTQYYTFIVYIFIYT